MQKKPSTRNSNNSLGGQGINFYNNLVENSDNIVERKDRTPFFLIMGVFVFGIVTSCTAYWAGDWIGGRNAVKYSFVLAGLFLLYYMLFSLIKTFLIPGPGRARIYRRTKNIAMSQISLKEDLDKDSDRGSDKHSEKRLKIESLDLETMIIDSQGTLFRRCERYKLEIEFLENFAFSERKNQIDKGKIDPTDLGEDADILCTSKEETLNFIRREHIFPSILLDCINETSETIPLFLNSFKPINFTTEFLGSSNHSPYDDGVVFIRRKKLELTNSLLN